MGDRLKQEVGHWDEEVVSAHLGTSRPAAVWGSQSTPAGQKHPGRASNRKSARYLSSASKELSTAPKPAISCLFKGLARRRLSRIAFKRSSTDESS